MKLVEMDENVAIAQQLGSDLSPVILINHLSVDPQQADELISAWTNDAVYFKSQPGFISTQLHRGIAGSGAFLNYAVWESVACFRKAFLNPEFRSKLAKYPPSVVARAHLFEKLHVPGICVG